MDQHGKAELIRALRKEYARASKREKSRIIDQLVSATGFSRKHAIARFNDSVAPPKRIRRPRTGRYEAVTSELQLIWATANFICGKRLQPFMKELIEALKRHGEIVLSDEQEALLISISAATIDRLLAGARKQMTLKGRATTKPGALLKHQIPIRTYADWDGDRPGFLEVDLVAHCGTSTAGEYANTLTMADVRTGWTVCCAFMGRSERFCLAAIEKARRSLPFPLLGLDSDNDAVFINAHMLRYCQRNSITFTRCRPYKKNDQCHVEQKNWDVVRKTVGYGRYDTAAQLALLRQIWTLLADYQNYFQPSRKLVSKTRHGARVKRVYDPARTPAQRLLERSDVPEKTKDRLRQTYERLNPAALIRAISELVRRLQDTQS